MKKELDEKAERKARNFMLRLVGLNSLIIAVLALLFFTGKLLWSNFEQWHALAGLFLYLVVNGICVAVKGEGLSLERMRERRLEKVKRKLYAKAKFVEAHYELLIAELDDCREKIKRFR